MNIKIPFNKPYMTGKELHYISEALPILEDEALAIFCRYKRRVLGSSADLSALGLPEIQNIQPVKTARNAGTRNRHAGM